MIPTLLGNLNALNHVYYVGASRGSFQPFIQRGAVAGHLLSTLRAVIPALPAGTDARRLAAVLAESVGEEPAAVLLRAVSDFILIDEEPLSVAVREVGRQIVTEPAHPLLSTKRLRTLARDHFLDLRLGDSAEKKLRDASKVLEMVEAFQQEAFEQLQRIVSGEVDNRPLAARQLSDSFREQLDWVEGVKAILLHRGTQLNEVYQKLIVAIFSSLTQSTMGHSLHFSGIADEYEDDPHSLAPELLLQDLHNAQRVTRLLVGKNGYSVPLMHHEIARSLAEALTLKTAEGEPVLLSWDVEDNALVIERPLSDPSPFLRSRKGWVTSWINWSGNLGEDFVMGYLLDLLGWAIVDETRGQQRSIHLNFGATTVGEQEGRRVTGAVSQIAGIQAAEEERRSTTWSQLSAVLEERRATTLREGARSSTWSDELPEEGTVLPVEGLVERRRTTLGTWMRSVEPGLAKWYRDLPTDMRRVVGLAITDQDLDQIKRGERRAKEVLMWAVASAFRGAVIPDFKIDRDYLEGDLRDVAAALDYFQQFVDNLEMGVDEGDFTWDDFFAALDPSDSKEAEVGERLYAKYLVMADLIDAKRLEMSRMRMARVR